MSRETNRRLCWTLFVALALAACPPGARAQGAAPEADNNIHFAPVSDNAPAATADRAQLRKTAMKKVALVSLLLILLLLCFIVVVMIVTRRMRIRYLHYDRKVTFGRLWDVWWSPRGGASGDAKKKPKP